MEKYIRKIEYKKISTAKDISDLASTAKRILERMPKPIIQICGPISTGKNTDIKNNIKELKLAIKKAGLKNMNVFNQMIFEPSFNRLSINWKPGKKYADMPILKKFYGEIFKSSLIDTIYFLPNWEYSFGAKWEYKFAKRIGIKIKTLPTDWKKKGSKDKWPF